MGAISFSIDPSLLKSLSSAGKFKRFVETGTYHGATARLASTLFEEVWTVEASRELHSRAMDSFRSFVNIHSALSDSASWLGDLRPRIQDSPSVFWLDAHWCCADTTSGEESQCPLLAELEAISPLHPDDIILIDDARLFLCTPPPPHATKQWPLFSEVVDHLRSLSTTNQISVINDVICFYPERAAYLFRNYTAEHLVDLTDIIWKAREFEKLVTAHELRMRNPLRKAAFQLKKIASTFLRKSESNQ